MHVHLIQRLTAVCAVLFGGMTLLTSCGDAAQSDRLTIVTTVYATYDLAKQLTADFDTPCEIKLLLTPGGESHAFEPTPSDAAAIQSCDLLVYIGGASEQWVGKMIESSRQNKANLRMFDHVDLLDEETVAGMQTDEAPDEQEPDEHIWTSPVYADAMLDALRSQINEIAPAESAHCDAAYESVHADLLALDAQAREIRENAAQDTLIFADRFPFRYLTAEYDWQYYAAFSGCSSDTDASAATLSFLISKVNEMGIDTVFYLENSAQQIADAVCRATGAEAVMMQSLNNVSADDLAANKHYQDLMRENLAAIQEAVN